MSLSIRPDVSMDHEPPLLSAARRDAYGLLDQLLSAGENPNQTNNAGETALILATQRGFEKAVARLLEAGADPLQTGGDITQTIHACALSFARKNGNIPILKMLLDAIKLDSVNNICYFRSSEMYTSFHDDGLLKVENVTCQPLDVASLPPLFQAIHQNDLSSFKKALTAGADPHETLSNGLAALHTVIRLHRHEMFDLLLEIPVNIDQTADQYHYSPLFVSVYAQNRYAYRKLINLGAQDLPTIYRHTALFPAVYLNDMPVIQELIARGSDIHQFICQTYCSLLYSAALYGHSDVVRYLLSLGLDPNGDPEKKPFFQENLFYGSPFTPLAAAVRNGDIVSVILLLEAGADPNLRSNGVPPLHFAAPLYCLRESETLDYPSIVRRYLAIIDLLLTHGATLNAEAELNHLTFLNQCILRGHEEIAAHLITAGASTDKKDKRGKSPLDYAEAMQQALGGER